MAGVIDPDCQGEIEPPQAMEVRKGVARIQETCQASLSNITWVKVNGKLQQSNSGSSINGTAAS